MTRTWHVYLRWMRDRRRSTIWWSVGIALVSAVTAAFYPSLRDAAGQGLSSSDTMSSVLGLGTGIDPSTPVGFLWSFNYSNQLPWLLMALGIALGTASIAGDESEGTLEYLLAKPVTRTQIAMARFAGMITVLVIASIVNLVAVAAIMPFVELTDSVTVAAADGTTATSPGATIGDLFVGGLERDGRRSRFGGGRLPHRRSHRPTRSCSRRFVGVRGGGLRALHTRQRHR